MESFDQPQCIIILLNWESASGLALSGKIDRTVFVPEDTSDDKRIRLA